MKIHHSSGAYQDGFGSDRYKTVKGLDSKDKEALEAGKVVCFVSRPAHNGKSGTRWRIVKVHQGKFYPRVPDKETLEAIEELFYTE